MSNPHRIYIAGPMTPKGTENHAIEYLANINAGIRAAILLMQSGFVPYCPMIDYNYFLGLKAGESIPEDMIRKVSLSFLTDWAEAVLLLPGWRTSTGVVRDELPACARLLLPVFEDLGNLCHYFDVKDKLHRGEI